MDTPMKVFKDSIILGYFIFGQNFTFTDSFV